MFQLIIAILSIALIATLAIASVYYGGEAFTSGTAKAGAATVVSQAQQISAADVLYQSTHAGAHAADVSALVSGNYLQSSPQVPDNIGQDLKLDQATGLVYGQIANKGICTQINAQLGVDTIPSATSSSPSDIEAAISEQYGCASTGGGGNGTTYYFAYK